MPLVMNIMLIQIRAGIVFAVLVAIALAARKADPEVHKRLLFLATAAPLPALLFAASEIRNPRVLNRESAKRSAGRAGGKNGKS